MSSLKLVVFDCDGTLVDSQFVIAESMRRAFAAHGLEPLPREAVRRVVGLPLEQSISWLLPDMKPRDHKAIAQSFRDTFFDLHHDPSCEEPLFDGARACLEALEGAGYLMAVATGKSRRGLRRILENHDLGHFFQALKTAEDGPGKPDPQILKDIMADCGVGPADTAVVGDTTFDIMMAGNAGAFGIGVEWGYHQPEELRAAGACEVVAQFEALPPFVRELLPL
ncbi:MAG: HAD family hydrolase [Alphaproteobacteria bacterium]|nr:MAG: HAD family hydrolase [Alphaproteobacteria bacterium]